MKVSETKEAIKHIFAIGRTPHLIGKHGTGKSSVVYQIAEELGYKVAERRLGQMADAGDLIGLQEFIKDIKTGNATHTKHVLPDWFPREENTIIFLDEVNRSHKDLLQAVFELVYDKSLAGVKLPKNCHVVAASNPATDDYSVLDFSDAAFQDRFVHLMFTPTVEEWMSFGRQKKFANSVVDFIAEFPKMLENQDLQAFDLSFVKPSRRSWEAVAKLEEVQMDEALRTEINMGIVGMEAAQSFRTFKTTYAKTVKPEDVLADYDKVRGDVVKLVKAERNDLLGILTSGLKELVETKTSITKAEADNIMALGKDLPVEHVFAMYKSLITLPAISNVEGEDSAYLLESPAIDETFTKVSKARKAAMKEVEKKKSEKK
jgi:hypothetical protein